MNVRFLLIILICFNQTILLSQSINNDTARIVNMAEVTITANRLPVNLIQNSGASSVVNSKDLNTMPRSIAVDEALRQVPGLRIDNQANGSRVHMSIRGQGILSERGLRGIKVLVDGIPVNDPSGFAPDLYETDWATVQSIEVLRGSAASLYGGSGNAGVLNITTMCGGVKPFGGSILTSIGSNGFYKVFGQANGSLNRMDYRISLSGIQGNGYRQHSAFWGNNLSEKINWRPTEKISLTQVLMVSGYFNQNAEGLSIDQLNDPKQANPDAIPFNEYQKTQRITNGFTGDFKISKNQDLLVSGFVRWTRYKEPGSSTVQYRDFITPGGAVQYNINSIGSTIHNHLGIGMDFQYQRINEYKVANIKDSTRTEEIGEIDETVIEGNTLLANQVIDQTSLGIFLVDRMEIGEKLGLIFSVRYDDIKNKLTDKLNGPVDLSGKANFNKTTARLGVSYGIAPALNLYGNYSLGFLPPATEELANNPESFGGFNSNLVPATSAGEEIGIKGNIGLNVFYDFTAFILNTENDFYRYRILPQRPLETFYGNAGRTHRGGIESFIAYSPMKKLRLQMSYTYSDFRYMETSSDSMMTNGEFLPAIIKGNYLPNSPRHQLYFEVDYHSGKHLSIGLSSEYQSEWYIYTNSDVTQQGFNLYHARIGYNFIIGKVNAEFLVFGKNLTNQHYMGFTEPDPDGNCYQPASGREFFGTLKLMF
jgi:iron complex outermembrane receptor protein